MVIIHSGILGHRILLLRIVQLSLFEHCKSRVLFSQFFTHISKTSTDLEMYWTYWAQYARSIFSALYSWLQDTEDRPQ